MLGRSIRFALDTNMFYQGFPSRSKLPGDTCYLLVDIVYEEIEAAMENTHIKPEMMTHSN